MFDDPGVTSTDATGSAVATTAMLEVPVTPSLVAEIVADPAETPVTRPADDTVATPGASLAQTIVRPVSISPPASNVAAPSCSVAPTATVADCGLTSTVATGSTGPPALISTARVPAFVRVDQLAPAVG